LRAGTLADAEAFLAGIDPAVYNPFNLVVADAHGARAYYGRDGWSREDIPAGLSVLPNDRLDSPWFPKVARARALVAPLLSLPWPELRPALFRALGDHDKPEAFPPTPPGIDRAFVRELHALCVHTPVYGTRSAMVAALRPGAVAEVWFADGPPCTTAPVDATPLLAVR